MTKPLANPTPRGKRGEGRPTKKRDAYGRPMAGEARKDDAMCRFAENIDMASFQMILGESEDEKLQTFLILMHDPAYARYGFSTLARKCRLTLQRLQEVYTDGMRHLGLLRMASHLPQVMEDVAIDAENTLTTCPRCDGLMVTPFGENGTRPCPQCEGTGKVKHMGDKHARDLMFETAKLTGQKGPLLAIQQIFGGDARMETMLKKTRAIVLEPVKPEKAVDTIASEV